MIHALGYTQQVMACMLLWSAPPTLLSISSQNFSHHARPIAHDLRHPSLQNIQSALKNQHIKEYHDNLLVQRAELEAV